MNHIYLFLIFICSFGLLFHPGRTDEDGGHTDSSTGEYHYHHGYPAHQHPDGKCPYEDQEPIYTHHESNSDNTRISTSTPTQAFISTPSSTSVSRNTVSSQPSEKTGCDRPLEWYEFLLIFAIPLGLFFIIVAWVNVTEWISRLKKKRNGDR